jgi:hypothetical protein
MPYSPKHQYIFTHIMKTAGSSLVQRLEKSEDDRPLLLRGKPNLEINHVCGFNEKQSMEHLTPQQIRRVIGWHAFNTAFRFTIVRNPWDRVVSTYFWIRQGDPHADPRMKSYCEEHSFEDFAKEKSFFWPPLQFPHVFNPKGQSHHHKVCRYENLENDLKDVFQSVGLDPEPLGHKNKTDHKPYTEYYTAESREAVAKKYAKDINSLGYQFKPND